MAGGNDQPLVLQEAQIADDAGNIRASEVIRDLATHAHMGQQFWDPAGGTE